VNVRWDYTMCAHHRNTSMSELTIMISVFHISRAQRWMIWPRHGFNYLSSYHDLDVTRNTITQHLCISLSISTCGPLALCCLNFFFPLQASALSFLAYLSTSPSLNPVLCLTSSCPFLLITNSLIHSVVYFNYIGLYPHSHTLQHFHD